MLGIIQGTFTDIILCNLSFANAYHAPNTVVSAGDAEINKTLFPPSSAHHRMGQQSARVYLLCTYCMPITRLQAAGDIRKEYTLSF